jgi:hypothetical protein
MQVEPNLDAAFKRNPLNIVIACAVIVAGIAVLVGRREAAGGILKFYERPSDEELRWFERRPNPSPFQAMLMACALGLAAAIFGVVILIMTLRA